MADYTSLVPHPRSSEDVFYVPDSLAHQDVPAEVLESPIRRSARGLGQVSLKGYRTTGGQSAEQPLRHHRIYGLTVNDFQHGVEVTDPSDGQPEYAIMSFPGFTEHIECGIRQDFHAGLAKIFPKARVISVGTDGIGPNSTTYGWRTRREYNLSGMARHRIEIGLALASQLPLFVQATSMGAPISHRMNRMVLSNPQLKEAMDIRGQFYTSPALVDPHNIPRDMAARFLPNLMWDFVKELSKSTPAEVAEILRNGKNYGLEKREAAALGNQLLGLLHGTKEKEVIEVTSQIPTVVVAGEKDCLAQWSMWERAEAANPGMVELHRIKGRGHVMAMKPGRTCDKLSRTAQAKVCHSLGIKPDLTVV